MANPSAVGREAIGGNLTRFGRLPGRSGRYGRCIGAFVCIAVLGVLAAVGEGLAQQDDSERAYALFEDAKKSVDSGRFSEAIGLLDEALEIFRHPGIILLKAHALRRLHRLDEARALIDEAAGARQLPKPLKARVDEELAKIQEAMQVRGRLHIEVTPKEAVISVLGEQFRGSVDQWVPGGEHVVEVMAPGYKPEARKASVVVGRTTNLRVELRRIGGKLVVEVPGGLKGVEIRIDGEPVEIAGAVAAGDRTPPQAVTVGEHAVECRLGERRSSARGSVGDDQIVTLTCQDLHPGGLGRQVMGWGGVAAGAGLAGYGAWALQSYFSDQEYADRNNLRIVSTSKHYGGAAYLVGGLTVGVLSYWLLVREPGDKSADDEPRREAAQGRGAP